MDKLIIYFVDEHRPYLETFRVIIKDDHSFRCVADNVSKEFYSLILDSFLINEYAPSIQKLDQHSFNKIFQENK